MYARFAATLKKGGNPNKTLETYCAGSYVKGLIKES